MTMGGPKALANIASLAILGLLLFGSIRKSKAFAIIPSLPACPVRSTPTIVHAFERRTTRPRFAQTNDSSQVEIFNHDSTNPDESSSSLSKKTLLAASAPFVWEPKLFLKRTRSALVSVRGALVSMGSIALKELKELTPSQKGLLAATFFLGFILGRLKPFWKRFTSVMDISPSYFGPTAPPLVGRAVSVSDGDTIRFLHTPTWFSPKKIRKDEKVSDLALPIRVCTIDTPETPKFGKPGQPFGEDAKAKLKELVDKKVVKARLLQKDQYGRAVAQVYTTGPFWSRKNVDEQMLEAGLAEVYQGSGAVYGPQGEDAYLELENKARTKKQGIWSQKRRESAADYKKRTK